MLGLLALISFDSMRQITSYFRGLIVAIHIRNLRSSYVASNYMYYRWWLWLFREIMVELAGWTEIFKTVDASWASASNLLLTVTDAAVDSSYPKRITSATGGFTGHAGDYVTLKASNDQNKGVFRIEYVADDNTIYISEDSKPANGWVTESGITARIHNMGKGEYLASSNVDLVIQPPTGNNQFWIGMDTNGNLADVRAYPKGDYLGAATGTSIESIDAHYQDYRSRSNFYINGSSMLFYVYTSSYFYIVNFGELLSTSPSDTYPGFCSGSFDAIANASYSASPTNWDSGKGMSVVNMLSHLDNPLTGYTLVIKSDTDDTAAAAHYDGYDHNKSWPDRIKMQGGKTKAEEKWVCMSDSAEGGYPRGKLPTIRQANNSLPEVTGVSSNWIHLYDGLLVPRDGLNDNRISSN